MMVEDPVDSVGDEGTIYILVSVIEAWVASFFGV